MKDFIIYIIFFMFVIPIFCLDLENTLPPENITKSNVSGFLDNYYQNTETANTKNDTLIESPALVLLRIVLITSILGFLTWLIIRFFFRRNALSVSTSGKSIEILATVPAGLGVYFLIAKLSSLYYLCSLSNEGVRMLDKITDQEAIDFIELNKPQTLPQSINFVDLLQKIPEGKPKQALDFLKDTINQLKKQ